MALPKEVQDAVAAADSAMVGCDDTIGVRQWQTIRAELHRLSDELADYKNASLHAADDCTAKDAEIKRLQSRLAAAYALLRDALHQWPSLSCDAFHHRKSDQHSGVEECEPLRRWRALYVAIQSHLSENSRES